MRVLVIYCHPDETSFASALHAAVLESLTASGHAVMDLDLYGEGFNPIMTRFGASLKFLRGDASQRCVRPDCQTRARFGRTMAEGAAP